MKNVLFLCTGNSCRSQMAEGWAKSLISDTYLFHSAGTKKSQINPLAKKVMNEVNVDISDQFSKTVDELPDATMDFIITLCSDADENCPVFPGGKILHVPFPDPPRLTSEMTDEEQILEIYRKVRDDIKTFILELPKKIEL